MKLLLKAFLWSIGFEASLIVLGLGGYVGLGFLPYLALAFHFPAFYLLQHWPSIQYGFIAPILVQWSIWFVGFTIIFVMARLMERKNLEHEPSLP